MTREEKIICKSFLHDADNTHSCNEYKLLMELLEQEPTTKNDLAQERYQDLKEYFGDNETAKTILEDKKEFKAWLERVKWHVKRADELARELEQIKGTTKNNLGVDCISRQSVLDKIQRLIDAEQNNIDENGDYMNYARERVNAYEAIQFFVENDCLCPSVTPQPRKGHWKLVQRGKMIDVCCSNCEAVRIKEYAYNYTIDELNKEDINECFGSAEMRYCPNCGAKMVEAQ